MIGRSKVAEAAAEIRLRMLITPRNATTALNSLASESDAELGRLVLRYRFHFNQNLAQKERLLSTQPAAPTSAVRLQDGVHTLNGKRNGVLGS